MAAFACALALALTAACTTKNNAKRGPTTTTTTATTTKPNSKEAPAPGGSISIALEAEPATLNPYSSAAAKQPQTATIAASVLSQLMIYDPKLQYQPQLLRSLPQVISQTPFRVRYDIRPEATWDDGTPVTAADVQSTLDQILNPANDVANRQPYTYVKDGKLVDVSPDGHQFTIEFTQPYGPWMELFASANAPILEAAKMQGQNFNTALNNGIPFSSGPYKVAGWIKGQLLALDRNDAYWGPHKAYLDRIAISFAPNPDQMTQMLSSAQIQAAYQIQAPDVAPQWRALPALSVQVTNGPLWEHIDFDNRDTLLQQKELRQAVAYGIDRDEIVAQVEKPIDPSAVPLQNVFFATGQPGYEPHWQVYHRDLTKVNDLMTSQGFSKGADGIYTRGSQRFTVTVSTTAGSKLRQQVLAIMKQQLAEAGIELAVQELPPEQLFDKVPNCDYQAAEFAYRGSPAPSWANNLYLNTQISCPGPDQNVNGQNSMAYRNVGVTQQLNATVAEPDPRKRLRIYNSADAQIADDAPTLPLFERATIFAFDRHYQNLLDNPTIQGPLWNAGEWWLAKSPSPVTTTTSTTVPQGTIPSSTVPPSTTRPSG